MDTHEYNYPEHNIPEGPSPEEIAFTEERKDLRSRCNSVGLITIIAIVVFLMFSLTLVLIQGIVTEISNSTLPSYLDSIPDNLLGGFANIAGIGIIGFIFLKSRSRFSKEPLPFNALSGKKLWSLVLIGFTICMLSNLLTNVYMNTLFSLGIDISLDYDLPVTDSWAEIIVELISTAIVPAFSEEILFRGIVLSTLRKYGDGFAVFVSSFIFGLFHGNLIQFPFAFLVGIVLGWTLVYAESMLPAILIHCFNNAFSVINDVLFTNAADWGLNEDLLDVLVCVIVAIAAVFAVIIAAKMSKSDKNFLKLKKYEGVLDAKTKTKMLVTSPTIIVSCVLLTMETLLTHFGS